MNKKGIVLSELFVAIIISLVIMVVIGSLLYMFGVIDTTLTGGDIQAGQVNLSNSSANTIGKINTAFLNNADIIGILFLFGLVFAIIISGFLTREMHPSVFFVVDILILLFAYILAVYISNSWETILNVLPFASTITSNMPTSTRFMLLLPRITVITGALTLIVTYAGIPRTKEEEVAGF